MPDFWRIDAELVGISPSTTKIEFINDEIEGGNGGYAAPKAVFG